MTTINQDADLDTPVSYWPTYHSHTCPDAAAATPPGSVTYWPTLINGQYAGTEADTEADTEAKTEADTEAETEAEAWMDDGPGPEWYRELALEAG